MSVMLVMMLALIFTMMLAMMLAMSFMTFYGSKLLQILSLHKVLLMHGNKLQTKWKCIIYSIIIVVPTQHKSLITLSNFVLKVTLKFTIHIYHPTLRCGEKVITKVNPIVNVRVEYPRGFVRSLCMCLKPLPAAL